MARTAAALAVGVFSALGNAQAFFGGDQSVCGAGNEFVDLGCYAGNYQTVLTPFLPASYDPANPSVSYPGFDAGTNYNATVTPQTCTTACRGFGYRTATLFNGQCACGYDVPQFPVAIAGTCDFACDGDASQNCGGAASTEVFVDPSFADYDTLQTTLPGDLEPYYQYLGCFAAADNFPTEDPGNTQTTQDTATLCLAHCAGLGYPLARATPLG